MKAQPYRNSRENKGNFKLNKSSNDSPSDRSLSYYHNSNKNDLQTLDLAHTTDTSFVIMNKTRESIHYDSELDFQNFKNIVAIHPKNLEQNQKHLQSSPSFSNLNILPENNFPKTQDHKFVIDNEPKSSPIKKVRIIKRRISPIARPMFEEAYSEIRMLKNESLSKSNFESFLPAPEKPREIKASSSRENLNTIEHEKKVEKDNSPPPKQYYPVPKMINAHVERIVTKKANQQTRNPIFSKPNSIFAKLSIEDTEDVKNSIEADFKNCKAYKYFKTLIDMKKTMEYLLEQNIYQKFMNVYRYYQSQENFPFMGYEQIVNSFKDSNCFSDNFSLLELAGFIQEIGTVNHQSDLVKVNMYRYEYLELLLKSSIQKYKAETYMSTFDCVSKESNFL